jgi:hypothetical protein
MAKVTASMTAPLRGEKRWAYLARQKSIRVASLNSDGTIYLSPLWYVIADQRIFIPIDAGSRHGQNADEGRAISALVDAGDEYATVSGVRFIASLVETTDEALIERLQNLMFEKYFHVGHPYAEQYFEFGTFAGRRYLEVVPTKTIGWDSRETTMPAVPESRELPEIVTDRPLPSS